MILDGNRKNSKDSKNSNNSKNSKNSKNRMEEKKGYERRIVDDRGKEQPY